jgi:hypothetical protein
MNSYKILIKLFFSFSSLFANIKYTVIFLIDGFDIQEISNFTSTNIINGQITKIIKRNYSFNPIKDFILVKKNLH